MEASFYSLAKDGGSDSGFSLSSTIINLIHQRDGVESSRKMYKRWVSNCISDFFFFSI